MKGYKNRSRLLDNHRSLNKFLNEDRKTLYMILSILMILVLTLTVVYAMLSTTLNISGNAEVSAANWDIYFDNIEVNSASVEATKVPTKTDSKTIDFAVTLTKPGDFYKFSVDIVNNGTIDAMIDSVVKTPELTSEQAKYIKYEIEYTDGNSISSKQLLPKNETKTISVLVSYRSDISSSNLPTSAASLSLSFTMIYTQADETGIVVPDGTLVKVVSGDLDTVGSEVAIGNEHFYIMKNDGRSVTMLAKYNLHVGNHCTSDSVCVPYGAEATGIQDATAIGTQWDAEGNYKFPFIGTIEFSSEIYWLDSSTEMFKTDYLIDYETNPYVYDSNSTLYSYIENYKVYLENFGLSLEEARLIKLSELVKLGCSKIDNSCSEAPKWVYSTSYWTGVVGKNSVWYVDSYDGLYSFRYNIYYRIGVRPVIKISLSEF